jgi:hypothetical protein
MEMQTPVIDDAYKDVQQGAAAVETVEFAEGELTNR